MTVSSTTGVSSSATPRVQTITYAASVTLDCNAADVFLITLTGNITIDFTNGSSYQKAQVILTQDATGSRLVTWGTSVSLGSDISSATATTTANKIDYFGVQYNPASAKYHMIALARGY